MPLEVKLAIGGLVAVLVLGLLLYTYLTKSPADRASSKAAATEPTIDSKTKAA